MFLLTICLLFGYCCAEACDIDGDHGGVRLEGGPSEFEGRVEVCLQGVWARWCHTAGVVDNEASVICRQLGHTDGGFGVLNTGFHGVGSSSDFISNVECGGAENNITECTFDMSTEMESCNDVAVVCKDPFCVDQESARELVSSITEDLVEVCDNSGFRAGLCCEDFTAETAAVLCRQQAQQGLTNMNPDQDVRAGDHDVNHFSTFFPYSCNGSEERFKDCQSTARTGQQPCQNIRLNCSDITSVNPCPATASGDLTIPSVPPTSTSGDSDTVVIVLVVVCVTLVLLMAIGVVILVIMCYVRKGKVTLDKSGISNINYGLSSKAKPQDVAERTVHNDLYTRKDILAAGTTSTAATPHVYDYALSVQQHTLLHSMASNSESSSHAYSKPTTPLTNYDRTVNSFDALGSSSPPAGQANDYSTLNGIHTNPVLDPSQSCSEVGQYSQIDDNHKYSKLSDMNSKGYSQLDMCGSLPPAEQQPPQELIAQPYETPLSPASNCTEDSRDHAYSTVAAETDSTGYSKLHVLDGNQGNIRITMQPNAASASTTSEGIDQGAANDELVDNQAYNSKAMMDHYELQY